MSKADTKQERLLGRLATDAASAGLTPREWETVSLLRLGLSDKEIGQRMQIETCTVNAFLKRIFPKFGAHTRRQAVQKVFGGELQNWWACTLILVPYFPSSFLLTPGPLRCQIGSSLWCLRIQPLRMGKRSPFLIWLATRELLQLDQNKPHYALTLFP